MPTDEKAEVELRPFTLTGDFLPKIVVRKDIGKRWYDDNGILNINVIDLETFRIAQGTEENRGRMKNRELPIFKMNGNANRNL